MEPFTMIVIAGTLLGAAGFLTLLEKKKPEVLSVVHQHLYAESAKLTDPTKLLKMADAFAHGEKPMHAVRLRKLAELHANKPGKPKYSRK